MHHHITGRTVKKHFGSYMPLYLYLPRVSKSKFKLPKNRKQTLKIGPRMVSLLA
jgi:hypothetical protein